MIGCTSLGAVISVTLIQKISDESLVNNILIHYILNNILLTNKILLLGTLTYTPHQIGIKHIKDAGADLEAGQPLIPPVSSNRPRNYMDPGEVMPDPDLDLPDQQQTFDSVDHLIELHGHIIGMCLSPDQRCVE